MIRKIGLGISLVVFILYGILVNYISPSSLLVNLAFFVFVLIVFIYHLSLLTKRKVEKVSGIVINIETHESLEDSEVYDNLTIEINYKGAKRLIEIKSTQLGFNKMGLIVDIYIYNGNFNRAQLYPRDFRLIWYM